MGVRGWWFRGFGGFWWFKSCRVQGFWGLEGFRV